MGICSREWDKQGNAVCVRSLPEPRTFDVLERLSKFFRGNPLQEIFFGDFEAFVTLYRPSPPICERKKIEIVSHAVCNGGKK